MVGPTLPAAIEMSRIGVPPRDAAPLAALRHEDVDDNNDERKDDDVAESSPFPGGINPRADVQITELARQLTRQTTRASGVGGEPINPFLDIPPNSALDPNGPNFQPRAWMKNMMAIRTADPDRYPSRSAGFAFRNLSVHGFGKPTDYQKNVANLPLELFGLVRGLLPSAAGGDPKRKIQILHSFDGIVNAGEMLVVLGRPGSGCSTFLKTIAGEMNGLYLDRDSHVSYQGISYPHMHSRYRGEAIYTAETDVHFPQLSVGDTLDFAALARTPNNRLPGVSRLQYARHMRDVFVASYGLSHTVNTRVGNDFVRGVSGGERKRVSIAEASLSQAPLQCWDNSTRGLDSANALEFCRTLRLATDFADATVAVSIYQASQSAFDVFDKVIVLYEGRQIYFGRTCDARRFFIDMGFHCPERQTTGDFLTSLTSPTERVVRPGFEGKTPSTPDDFVAAWKSSDSYAALQRELAQYDEHFPPEGEAVNQFVRSRRAAQSTGEPAHSPYTLSGPQQVALCIRRGFQRLRGDMSLTLTALIGNFIMALIIASVFYNLKDDSSSFYSRGALLFFAILMSGFASSLEILTLYAQRPIVEKHARYALYRPYAEAMSSMICDLPYKFLNSFTFNIPLYFMTNLRRSADAWWTYWLFSVITTLTMSMFFRTIGASSRTLAQALAPAAILILALVIYTGFVIPTRTMLGWSRWINYLDPVAYGFEAVMANEFHGRQFACSSFIPSYPGVSLNNQVCSVTGSAPGSSTVDGDAYLMQSYKYSYSHIWRNLGIIFGFMFFLMTTYLVATEFISEQKSKGEVLVFQAGHYRNQAKHQTDDDQEGAATATTAGQQGASDDSDRSAGIQRQTAIFHWQDVCYDIKIKGQPRRILDHVDGWVKPGTCTALMGVSGAGKTTLLDVLAERVTMGVVSGDMLVDGHPRDHSFQRKTGYVQQQDLHLSTSTVREALVFSALLRQPAHVPKQEKIDYVGEVIKLLGMEPYADAVVGVPGEGLNVEQRKRLTIAVELVAKPQLLLFLDEPTSGLDSQTSWSILDLLDTLTAHGQAILCTIHQPSAMLFQRFDRLLFLASGGKTVYYGDIGEHSSKLTGYFERNGASPCPSDANPAEWMLEVIGAAPGSHSDIDWPTVWRDSPERRAVREHLAELRETLSRKPVDNSDPSAYREFAAPFSVQLWECQKRVFEQYWRTPSYIYSKAALCVFTGLFIGFSFFKAKNTLQGIQNQMLGVFMLMTIFGNLVQQIMPNFTTQRALYEARERPSKTYSWKAFMLSNMLVELPWSTLMAVLLFVCWYYPIGLYKNAEQVDKLHERGALMFLLVLVFLWFTCTFSHMVVAGIETAETAGNIATMLFSLCLIFCGVLATPSAMPGFWIFMYRVSPFTYFVASMLSTGLAGGSITCADYEFVHFAPAANKTCAQYMEPWISKAGGYLDPASSSSTTSCSFCSMSSTDAFLAAIGSRYSQAWRDFGLLWAYVVFNIGAALFIYWLARVPKGASAKGPKAAASAAPGSDEQKQPIIGGDEKPETPDTTRPHTERSIDGERVEPKD